MNRNESTAAFQQLFLLVIVFASFAVSASLAGAQESPTTDVKNGIDREKPFQLRPFSPIAKRYRGKGISFGPFRKGQRPGKEGPTREQVKEDLMIIAKDGWQMIRTYGTEPFSKKTCEIIRAEKLPIK